jgi:hypothetical protein
VWGCGGGGWVVGVGAHAFMLDSGTVGLCVHNSLIGVYHPLNWEEQLQHFLNLFSILVSGCSSPAVWLSSRPCPPLWSALPLSQKLPRTSPLPGRQRRQRIFLFFLKYNLLTLPHVLQLQAVSHLECASQVRIFPAEIEKAAPRHAVRQIAAT